MPIPASAQVPRICCDMHRILTRHAGTSVRPTRVQAGAHFQSINPDQTQTNKWMGAELLIRKWVIRSIIVVAYE